MYQLVRAIYQIREFEERFLQVGIGYRVLGGIKFYERAEIKDAVSYLRIINQKYDDLALKELLEHLKEVLARALSTKFILLKIKQIVFRGLYNKDDL